MEVHVRPCGMPASWCFRHRQVVALPKRCRGRPTRSVAQDTSAPSRFMRWLEDNGLPEQNVRLQVFDKGRTTVDTVVAANPVAAGTTLLRVPERLVVTLDRVFQDSALAELLTTNKLSELACLTLYLAYEKKRGAASFWQPFIKELDRLRGRGPQGARSPLLWDEWEVETYLAGSPVLQQLRARIKGIEREYAELDTVWFLSGSLFNQYPYDIPTEQFSPEIFRQAFAAIQSCVVHLQGVPLSRRFALVPLGPPLLTYSSTARAMLRWDGEAREVVLEADRPYAPGEPVVAWCGPQPNARLLINYGIVDEANPYDRLSLEVTIRASDPLFRHKRARLADDLSGLTTQQAFQLARRDGGSAVLPATLLPFLRLAVAAAPDEVDAVDLGGAGTGVVGEENEATVLAVLHKRLVDRLAAYQTTLAQDDAIIASPETGPRQLVATRLLRIEKLILRGAISELESSQHWRGPDRVHERRAGHHVTLD